MLLVTVILLTLFLLVALSFFLFHVQLLFDTCATLDMKDSYDKDTRISEITYSIFDRSTINSKFRKSIPYTLQNQVTQTGLFDVSKRRKNYELNINDRYLGEKLKLILQYFRWFFNI